MRVLITNDDGVASEGLWALARSVVEAGHDAVVAAPTSDMTGMGGAIGGDLQGGELRAKRIQRGDLGATECWAVEGPPALCVVMTQLGAFGDPVSMVVSGVNPGLNCGRSALHSGTVGAALTAANNGAHGIAVSIDVTGGLMCWDSAVHIVPELIDRLNSIEKGRRVVNINVPNLPLADIDVTGGLMCWDSAVHIVPELIDRLNSIEKGRRVVNINVPNLPLADIAGVQIADLAKWGDAAGLLTAKDGQSWSFQRQPGNPKRRIPGTDNAVVRDGFISISELVGIRTQKSDLDLSDVSLRD